MSVALKTKRFEPASAAPTPTPKATVAPPRPRRYDDEAPESGVAEREAPESRSRASADHCEGRAYRIEHEFTHGRSQS